MNEPRCSRDEYNGGMCIIVVRGKSLATAYGEQWLRRDRSHLVVGAQPLDDRRVWCGNSRPRILGDVVLFLTLYSSFNVRGTCSARRTARGTAAVQLSHLS